MEADSIAVGRRPQRRAQGRNLLRVGQGSKVRRKDRKETFPVNFLRIAFLRTESSLSCGFRLCLTVLKHKGQQVEKQREEIEMLGKKKFRKL